MVLSLGGWLSDHGQYYSLVWMHRTLVVHSPAEGHVDRFQRLGFTGTAAQNTRAGGRERLFSGVTWEACSAS